MIGASIRATDGFVDIRAERLGEGLFGVLRRVSGGGKAEGDQEGQNQKTVFTLKGHYKLGG